MIMYITRSLLIDIIVSIGFIDTFVSIKKYRLASPTGGHCVSPGGGQKSDNCPVRITDRRCPPAMDVHRGWTVKVHNCGI